MYACQRSLEKPRFLPEMKTVYSVWALNTIANYHIKQAARVVTLQTCFGEVLSSNLANHHKVVREFQQYFQENAEIML